MSTITPEPARKADSPATYAGRRPRSPWVRMSAAIILLAPFFWATNTILAKAVIGDLPPMGFAFWRWFTAFLIIAPFAWPHWRRDWPLMRRSLPLLALLGATGTGGFNALLYLGLQWTDAINALLINSTSPAAIFAATFLLFGERPRWQEIAGGIVSLLGIVFIAARGDLAALAQLSLNPGDLAIVAAMVLYAIYSALLRRRPAIHPTSFLAATFLTGAFAVLPFWITELMMGRTMPPSGVAVASILYTALFPSILAYFCFNRSVAQLGANRAGLSLQLIPLFGAGLAIALLGETFGVYHAVGTALILGGLVLAHTARKKRSA